MTDKELKKLSRGDLLELLISQTKENERLTAKLAEADSSLDSRKIVLDDAGSIAEAALRLNGVFTAAQSAADQYLENIKTLSQRQKEACARREEVCVLTCERLVRETEAKCRRMEEETRQKCDNIMSVIVKDLQSYCEQTSRKMNLLNAQNGPGEADADAGQEQEE